MSSYFIFELFAIMNGQRAQNLSYAEIMSLKSEARDRQVSAVYAADEQSLENAGNMIKAVLRGSGNIARPRRFTAATN
ncbi:hypothetical protein ALQ04_00576 [Pseudomonas cichorii]|uniref:Uncharacterized protein n=1 Tax=Pseudomonas cichorii TaxID=36746 RepID=A0A3M4LJH7_PSECI|nr:hypothetical protein [Pseudomonas cichorii]RMQ41646.1 hypothetical protein ALQ04_00576 [Pseudomonas cichorii]